MKPLLILASTLVAAAAFGEPPKSMQMINLSCMEALVAIDQADLAGVFSFIQEKDGPAAFADLVVHDKYALKKFLGKVEKDYKLVAGVSSWDHDVIQFALSIYMSPLAETLHNPGKKVIARMGELLAAPARTLQEIATRRQK